MSKREESIRRAILELDNDPNLSEKAVAADYNIPRSTLRNRRAGGTSRAISKQSTQRLFLEQEKFLADWILEMGAQGFPPSHARTREMACQITRSNGDTAPLGKEWVCNLFKEVEVRHNIKAEDMWNIDEQGLGLGICSNTMVVASSQVRRASVKSPENREWVSTLEAISATGKIIKPLFIFKGKNPQLSWFEESTLDWTYTTTENGWTSNMTALAWLKEVFLPQTTPEENQSRMLLLDGHGSHATVDFMWECKKNNVHLVFLPPHSSHVLQPLDLGVFSPLKHRYRSIISDLAYLDAAPIKKRRFLVAYNQARTEALTSRLLRSGWKAAGLVTWNPEKGLKSSQVLQHVETTPERACTPPESILRSGITRISITTPKSARELHERMRSLKGRKNNDGWCVSLVTKAGKAIAMGNAQRARDQDKINSQDCLTRQLTTKSSQKRVPVDPNTRFATIEQIKQAQAEQRVREELLASGKPELEAKKAAEAMMNVSLQACQFEWQL
ncbi:hypothetical protein K3495_g11505 [Podosphaera aphanis]|nr:hypothetical protein K3495_g11505 [Podosphaera aphanis]